MAARLVCRNVFGLRPDVRGNILSPEEGTVFYASGSYVVKHDLKKNSQDLLRPAGGGLLSSASVGTPLAPDQIRVQTVTAAMTLSSTKRYIAIGEVGRIAPPPARATSLTRASKEEEAASGSGGAYSSLASSYRQLGSRGSSAGRSRAGSATAHRRGSGGGPVGGGGGTSLSGNTNNAGGVAGTQGRGAGNPTLGGVGRQQSGATGGSGPAFTPGAATGSYTGFPTSQDAAAASGDASRPQAPPEAAPEAAPAAAPSVSGDLPAGFGGGNGSGAEDASPSLAASKAQPIVYIYNARTLTKRRTLVLPLGIQTAARPAAPAPGSAPINAAEGSSGGLGPGGQNNSSAATGGGGTCGSEEGGGGGDPVSGSLLARPPTAEAGSVGASEYPAVATGASQHQGQEAAPAAPSIPLPQWTGIVGMAWSADDSMVAVLYSRAAGEGPGGSGPFVAPAAGESGRGADSFSTATAAMAMGPAAASSRFGSTVGRSASMMSLGGRATVGGGDPDGGAGGGLAGQFEYCVGVFAVDSGRLLALAPVAQESATQAQLETATAVTAAAAVQGVIGAAAAASKAWPQGTGAAASAGPASDRGAPENTPASTADQLSQGDSLTGTATPDGISAPVTVTSFSESLSSTEAAGAAPGRPEEAPVAPHYSRGPSASSPAPGGHTAASLAVAAIGSGRHMMLGAGMRGAAAAGSRLGGLGLRGGVSGALHSAAAPLPRFLPSLVGVSFSPSPGPSGEMTLAVWGRGFLGFYVLSPVPAASASSRQQMQTAPDGTLLPPSSSFAGAGAPAGRCATPPTSGGRPVTPLSTTGQLGPGVLGSGVTHGGARVPSISTGPMAAVADGGCSTAVRAVVAAAAQLPCTLGRDLGAACPVFDARRARYGPDSPMCNHTALAWMLGPTVGLQPQLQLLRGGGSGGRGRSESRPTSAASTGVGRRTGPGSSSSSSGSASSRTDSRADEAAEEQTLQQTGSTAAGLSRPASSGRQSRGASRGASAGRGGAPSSGLADASAPPSSTDASMPLVPFGAACAVVGTARGELLLWQGGRLMEVIAGSAPVGKGITAITAIAGNGPQGPHAAPLATGSSSTGETAEEEEAEAPNGLLVGTGGGTVAVWRRRTLDAAAVSSLAEKYTQHAWGTPRLDTLGSGAPPSTTAPLGTFATGAAAVAAPGGAGGPGIRGLTRPSRLSRAAAANSSGGAAGGVGSVSIGGARSDPESTCGSVAAATGVAMAVAHPGASPLGTGPSIVNPSSSGAAATPSVVAAAAVVASLELVRVIAVAAEAAVEGYEGITSLVHCPPAPAPAPAAQAGALVVGASCPLGPGSAAPLYYSRPGSGAVSARAAVPSLPATAVSSAAAAPGPDAAFGRVIVAVGATQAFYMSVAKAFSRLPLLPPPGGEEAPEAGVAVATLALGAMGPTPLGALASSRGPLGLALAGNSHSPAPHTSPRAGVPDPGAIGLSPIRFLSSHAAVRTTLVAGSSGATPSSASSSGGQGYISTSVAAAALGLYALPATTGAPTAAGSAQMSASGAPGCGPVAPGPEPSCSGNILALGSGTSSGGGAGADGAAVAALNAYCGAVIGMDTATRRPLLITLGSEGAVRVWNYVDRTCETAKTFPEAPLSVAIHPSGFLAVLGFPDRVRLVSLLLDDIKPIRGFNIKGCTQLRFSHGGQLFAASNGPVISVFDTYGCGGFYAALRGHSARVSRLVWAPNDATLLSCGADGAIYEWDLRDGKRRREFMLKGAKIASVAYAPPSPPTPGSSALGLLTAAAAVAVKFPGPGSTGARDFGRGGAPVAGQSTDAAAPAPMPEELVYAVATVTRTEGRTQEVSHLLLEVDLCRGVVVGQVTLAQPYTDIVSVRVGNTRSVIVSSGGNQPGYVAAFAVPLPAPGAAAAAVAAAAAAAGSTGAGAASTVAAAPTPWSPTPTATPATAPDPVAQCSPVPVSAAAILALRVGADGACVFAAGADGVIATLSLRDRDGRLPVSANSGGGEALRGSAVGGAAPSPWVQEALVTGSDLEDRANTISDLRERLAQITSNGAYAARTREAAHKDALKRLADHCGADIERTRMARELLEEEAEDSLKEREDRLEALAAAHEAERMRREAAYQGQLVLEIEKYEALQDEAGALRAAWGRKKEAVVSSNNAALAAHTRTYEQRVAAAAATHVELLREVDGVQRDWQETRNQMEEDLDTEVENTRHAFEEKLASERTASLKFKGENGILKKKFGALMKDIEAGKATVKEMLEKQDMLKRTIDGLEKEIGLLRAVIREKDDAIGNRERRIYDLKKKNQELEKFKFVLDHKIKELKLQIEPREAEIAAMRKQIKEVDAELDAYHHSNAELDAMIGVLRTQLDELQTTAASLRLVAAKREASIKVFGSTLHELVDHVGDPEGLAEELEKAYQARKPDLHRRTRSARALEQGHAAEDPAAGAAGAASGFNASTHSSVGTSASSSTANRAAAAAALTEPDELAALEEAHRQRVHLAETVAGLQARASSEEAAQSSSKRALIAANSAVIARIKEARDALVSVRAVARTFSLETARNGGIVDLESLHRVGVQLPSEQHPARKDADAVGIAESRLSADGSCAWPAGLDSPSIELAGELLLQAHPSREAGRRSSEADDTAPYLLTKLSDSSHFGLTTDRGSMPPPQQRRDVGALTSAQQPGAPRRGPQGVPAPGRHARASAKANTVGGKAESGTRNQNRARSGGNLPATAGEAIVEPVEEFLVSAAAAARAKQVIGSAGTTGRPSGDAGPSLSRPLFGPGSKGRLARGSVTAYLRDKALGGSHALGKR